MGLDMFISLIVIMVSLIYISKLTRILCCKYVQFLVCQLYLNETVSNEKKGDKLLVCNLRSLPGLI